MSLRTATLLTARSRHRSRVSWHLLASRLKRSLHRDAVGSAPHAHEADDGGRRPPIEGRTHTFRGPDRAGTSAYMWAHVPTPPQGWAGACARDAPLASVTAPDPRAVRALEVVLHGQPDEALRTRAEFALAQQRAALAARGDVVS